MPLERGMSALWINEENWRNWRTRCTSADGTSLDCQRHTLRSVARLPTEEGHGFWFSGDGDKKQHGVVKSVVSCTPVSSRIIKIRISAMRKRIRLIQAYSTTSTYDDDLVEEFYKQLESTIQAMRRKDLLIIQGDWNAKVGPHVYEPWPGTVGRFGVGETNEIGDSLLDFTHRHKMTMVNNLFPHKISRRTVWHSPMASHTTRSDIFSHHCTKLH